LSEEQEEVEEQDYPKCLS